MSEQLKAHHALVTGAGGGIGLAVTKAYLDEGARCTAVDLGAAFGEGSAAVERGAARALGREIA